MGESLEREQAEQVQKVQKRTFCRVCEPACGLLAEVEDDRLIALKPDPDHPVTKGFACHKGIFGLDIHHDPDRVNQPLRRNAAGEFEAIDWDTAIREITEKLNAIVARDGVSAVSCYTGNPTGFNSLYGLGFGAFVSQLGVRKVFSSGTQDCANKFAGSEAVFGTRTLHPIPDLEHTDYALIIGENPAVSHMSFFSIADPVGTLKEAEARGAKVVFVNPRSIETARHVGSVVHIKPDTDVYLLAALICEIERIGGFDDAIVARHGAHVDELIEFVREYPPERVSGITGIPLETLQRMAKEFAEAEAASAHMSTGVNMGRQGTLAYWLLHMLVFVTGNLGKRGGNMFGQGFYVRSPAAGRARGDVPEYVETPFGAARAPGRLQSLPGNLMADYLLNPDDPVKALFVTAGNPVLSIGGEEKMRAALEAMELYVHVDIYRNASAEYADYVLPATDAFERADINITGLGMQYRPSVQFTEAVVPAQHERKEEWWIYARLAQAMGFKSPLDDEEPQLWARTDAMLRSRGHSMEELRRDGIITFEAAEPDRFYSEFVQNDEQLVECFPGGFDEPRKRMATIFGELEAEPADQLKLISKRDIHMMNSWYANLPKMKHGIHDRNYLFMHPDDAAKRQIQEGARVHVSNGNGAIEVETKFTDELMKGVVAMTHGWGNRRTPGMQLASDTPGSNCNVLLPTGAGSYEPLSNQAHMTGISVDVRPAA